MVQFEILPKLRKTTDLTAIINKYTGNMSFTRQPYFSVMEPEIVEYDSDSSSVNFDLKTPKCNCVPTILCVDDNEFNLMPLCLMIEEEY